MYKDKKYRKGFCINQSIEAKAAKASIIHQSKENTIYQSTYSSIPPKQNKTRHLPYP